MRGRGREKRKLRGEYSAWARGWGGERARELDIKSITDRARQKWLTTDNITSHERKKESTSTGCAHDAMTCTEINTGHTSGGEGASET